MPESQREAGGKKSKLLCCKRIFDQIIGNLAEIQPKNHQNVQKRHFLQKVPGVNGLRRFAILTSVDKENNSHNSNNRSDVREVSLT